MIIPPPLQPPVRVEADGHQSDAGPALAATTSVEAPPLRHDVVVVPIDLSEDGVVALRAGLDRVQEAGGLHALHVLPPLTDYWASGLLEHPPGGETREHAARRRIAELIEEAGARGAKPVVLDGDPGLQTVAYAERVGAGLIIVLSHGYCGVKRLLIGSTAEAIVRHAHCPVLVLRRKAE